MIQPLPSKAAQFQGGSGTGVAKKSRRPRIVPSEQDLARLEADQDRSATVRKHVQRATIILRLGASFTLSQTLRVTGMSEPTVWRWWDRFLVAGVDGLPYDILRRRGRKPISADNVSERIALVMSASPEHAGRWTLRALAKKQGIAVSTMFRILKHKGQEPHRLGTFKDSRDPRFSPKRRGGVGFCVNPPYHVVFISVEAKTRIQAPGQTQKSLPMKPAVPRPEPMTASATAPPA